MFNLILTILLYASSALKSNYANCNRYVPGWNDHLKGLYTSARNKLFIWRAEGKQLGSESHNEMITSRKKFKTAFKKCKKHEQQYRNGKLVNSYLNKNTKQFWRQV